ncbi:hypothetical protein GCM10011490_28930 [Pseudoclavibacter endophyticus]|nr:hypothetical protein GCM10011490_28930 [Pseudoclavibacter endophyticus]
MHLAEWFSNPRKADAWNAYDEDPPPGSIDHDRSGVESTVNTCLPVASSPLLRGQLRLTQGMPNGESSGWHAWITTSHPSNGPASAMRGAAALTAK